MKAFYIAGTITFSALSLILWAGDEYLAATWAMNNSWQGQGPIEAAHAVYGHRFIAPLLVSLLLTSIYLALLIWDQRTSKPLPQNQ
ncbi:MAG TPA: hypothetical protein VHE55_02160 [Fimbriimonadaceae bacterium]|nr:hypothetical protein [Fimbriimonadaceae bacterium]